MRHWAARHLVWLAILSSVAGLAGCSPKADGPIAISGFTVTGTSAASQGVVPINPGVNNGQFLISWDITGTFYTATVALNSGPVFDPSTNVVLASGCGQQSAADVCHATNTLTCTFDNSDNMLCSDVAGPYATQNLAGFLAAGVPANAYIVLQACNASGSSCLTSSVPVQIQ